MTTHLMYMERPKICTKLPLPVRPDIREILVAEEYNAAFCSKES